MAENGNDSKDLNNPHDKFFKGAFSMLDVTYPLLVEFLPKDLLDKLDLNTLEIDPNSYIDDELKETFSDLVWSCRLKNNQQQRKIAFLFEHKSYKPAYPHFQINDYQRNAWKAQIAANQQPVPILPIIFYHGKEKWVVESFDSYFGEVEAEMLRFLPCFDYILINLQDYSDGYIKNLQSIFLQKTFLAFKHYLDKQYLEIHIVELLFHNFSNAKNELTRSFISIISVYLRAISGITREQLIEKVKQSDNILKPEAMSYVEEFIEEGKLIGEEIGLEIGKEIGKEIGIFEEKKRTALFFYQKKMTLQTIAEYVDLPLEQVKTIVEEHVQNRQSN